MEWDEVSYVSIHIQYEAWLLVLSFLTGIGLMIVYDLLRMLRLMIKHKSFFVGMEDVIYWIYAGLMTFTLLYRENNGIIRAYVIVSVFAGMAFYDVSVSRFFFHLLKKCRNYFKIKRTKRICKKQKD